MPPLADSPLFVFRSAPAQLDPPPEGAVHLWHLPLTLPPPADAVLSGEERARHGRYRFARDRDRFLTTHVATREILARYLATAPAGLAFAEGEWGKPALTPPHEFLQFNLSHSQDHALLAVTRDAPVGVDLEFHQSGLNFRELGGTILSPGEQERFEELEAEAQAAFFFQTWTAKEAFLKAMGTGLSLDPRATEAVFPASTGESGEVATLAPLERCRHHLRFLPFAPDYTAALCTPGPAHSITPYAYER